jgi:hypothetical protein
VRVRNMCVHTLPTCCCGYGGECVECKAAGLLVQVLSHGGVSVGAAGYPSLGAVNLLLLVVLVVWCCCSTAVNRGCSACSRRGEGGGVPHQANLWLASSTQSTSKLAADL